MSLRSRTSAPPLLLILLLPHLLLPSAASSSSSRARPVFGTERYARSAPSPHRRLLLRPAPFLLRQPLPGPRLAYPMAPADYSRREDPLESYRAFVEQEDFPEGMEDGGEEQGEPEGGPYASSEAAYRHAMRGQLPPLYSLPEATQYRFATPYTAYYERPPEIAATAYGRPATAAAGPRRLAADPVEDLEEEMRQEEEGGGGWAPNWWGGGEVEDDGEEAEREVEEEEEEEAAERAATDGAFLRNLILAQRYREDSLRPEVETGAEGGKRRRGGGRRADNGDRAVKELESLAGKRSGTKRAAPERPPATAAPEQMPPTTTTTTSSHPSERGQKEVAVPRPASPPRRPLEAGLLVGRRWPEAAEERTGGSGRSVYATLERLLEGKDSGALQRHRPSSQRSLQKRFVSGEDVMMRQLSELKRA